jgi:hypothetical protein
MRADMTELLGSREIFWDLQEVAKANERVLDPGAFFGWMCGNYIASMSIGIRKFVDEDRRSESLWRMLYQMLEHPGIIDVDAHARMYRSTPMGVGFGRRCFFNVAGDGVRCLSQRHIRSDLHKLEDACERVRRFVNKRIAHRTSPGKIRRLPKFSDVDKALDTLDEILCKYDMLLTARGATSCHATRQYNWQAVLWEPWIPAGSPLHPGAL